MGWKESQSSPGRTRTDARAAVPWESLHNFSMCFHDRTSTNIFTFPTQLWQSALNAKVFRSLRPPFVLCFASSNTFSARNLPTYDRSSLLPRKKLRNALHRIISRHKVVTVVMALRPSNAVLENSNVWPKMRGLRVTVCSWCCAYSEHLFTTRSSAVGRRDCRGAARKRHSSSVGPSVAAN